MIRALALVALLLGPAAALAGEHPGLTLRGNEVLPDEVYLAWLGDAIDEPGDPRARADSLAGRVRDFLHDAGYELARVRGTAQGGGILLDIDEGHVSRVVYRGRGTATTLQAKLLLSIPMLVYNRPWLTRQLATLASDHDIEARHELVPVAKVEHAGPQIEDLGPIPSIPGVAGIPPDGAYELHILMSDGEWNEGVGLHMKYSDREGLRPGLSYKGLDGLLEGDRWLVRGDLAATSFPEIDGPETHLDLSRAIAESRWYTPALGDNVRPFLWLYGDLATRPRFDLGVQSYRWLQSGALANLGYDLSQEATVSVGFGFEYRSLFDVDQPLVEPDHPFDPVAAADQYRGLGNLRLEVDLDPDEVRLDRRDLMHANLRGFFADSEARLWEIDAALRMVFPMGWHDVWLRAHLFGVFGDTAFAEEHPVDDALRGVFSDTWTRRMASAGAEFRFSLTRDVFKVSVYVDGATYEDRTSASFMSIPRVALGAGAGFHALVADVAQLDLYYGVGFATDGEFDLGLSAKLVKAF